MVWATDELESGGPVLQGFLTLDFIYGDIYQFPVSVLVDHLLSLCNGSVNWLRCTIMCNTQ